MSYSFDCFPVIQRVFCIVHCRIDSYNMVRIRVCLAKHLSYNKPCILVNLQSNTTVGEALRLILQRNPEMLHHIISNEKLTDNDCNFILHYGSNLKSLVSKKINATKPIETKHLHFSMNLSHSGDTICSYDKLGEQVHENEDVTINVSIGKHDLLHSYNVTWCIEDKETEENDIHEEQKNSIENDKDSKRSAEEAHMDNTEGYYYRTKRSREESSKCELTKDYDDNTASAEKIAVETTNLPSEKNEDPSQPLLTQDSQVDDESSQTNLNKNVQTNEDGDNSISSPSSMSSKENNENTDGKTLIELKNNSHLLNNDIENSVSADDGSNKPNVKSEETSSKSRTEPAMEDVQQQSADPIEKKVKEDGVDNESVSSSSSESTSSSNSSSSSSSSTSSSSTSSSGSSTGESSSEVSDIEDHDQEQVNETSIKRPIETPPLSQVSLASMSRFNENIDTRRHPPLAPIDLSKKLGQMSTKTEQEERMVSKSQTIEEDIIKKNPAPMKLMDTQRSPFHQFTLKELKTMCRDKNIPVSGKKSELITRIIASSIQEK